MLETVDVRVEDAERDLMGRLATLAQGNTSLGTALEAAQRLVEHRQTVDELIGQALSDAMGLERLQEEVRELEAQKKALSEALEQDSKALDHQLQQLALSLGGILDLLSNANDSIQELEGRLSSLLGRVEAVRTANRPEGVPIDSPVELESSEEGESSNGRPTEDNELRAPVEDVPAEAEVSLDESFRAQEEDVPGYNGPLDPVSEEERTEGGQAEEAEEDSLGVGSSEVADIPSQGVLDQEGGRIASGGGESEEAEKTVSQGQAVIGLQPGESWVVGMEKDIEDSTKSQEGDKAKNEDPTSWWGWFRT